MNCKPNDLAMVCAPYVVQGRGAIVKVLRPYRGEIVGGRLYVGFPDDVPWVVEGWVRNGHNVLRGPEVVISDACLRPLPGDDAVEDISCGASKPDSTKATTPRPAAVCAASAPPVRAPAHQPLERVAAQEQHP